MPRLTTPAAHRKVSDGSFAVCSSIVRATVPSDSPGDGAFGVVVTCWCRECHVCPPSDASIHVERHATAAATSRFHLRKTGRGDTSPAGKRVSAEVERAAVRIASLRGMEAIYERPRDYDLEHEGDEEDVAFYLRLLARWQPRRVIELAAGSGRVTLPLARAAAADRHSGRRPRARRADAGGGDAKTRRPRR